MAEQPFRVNDATASDELRVGNSKLFLNNTAVTATAAELNLLDGANLTANEFMVANTGGTSFTTTSVLQYDSANQRIGIGTSSPQVKLDMVSSTANETQFRMEQANNSADAPDVRIYKARGTVASKTAVADDDYLFGINSFAYDGSSYVNAGSLHFRADGISGDGYFTLSTTQGGTSSVRLATTDSGAIRISDAFTLPTSDGSASQVLQTDGSGTVSWATVSGGGGISIGDAVGSGTAGSILFVDASGNLAQDNTQLFWDDTNNRLGIGTTTPSHTLHVRNQAAGASTPIARFESDEGNILFNRYAGIMLQNNEPSGAEPIEANRWQIQQRDGDNIDPPDGPFDISYGDGSAGFVSASDTILRITSGGNVGIGLGNTDPSEALHVKGNVVIEDPSSTGTTDHLLEVKSGSSSTPDNARILISADTDAKLPMFHLRDIEANGGTFNGNYSAYFALDRATPVVTGSAQNDLLIANGNLNKDIHFCTNNTGNGSQAQARLTIVGSDGDVGIGTTSPSQKLHVVGTIRQTNSTNAVLVSNASGDIGSASNLQDIAYSDGLYADGSGMYPLVPPAPSAWGGAPPATFNEAIDRLAAAVYNSSGPIP